MQRLPVPPSALAFPLLPTTLTEFHLFPKLPQEIRDRVWKLSCMPRLVEIQQYGGLANFFRYFYTRAKPVPALIVCKDSRNSILPFYPKFTNSAMRLNLALDTIFIDESSTEFKGAVLDFFDTLSDEETRKFTSIAIANQIVLDLRVVGFEGRYNKPGGFWARVKQQLNKLPNLAHCQLVMDVRRVPYEWRRDTVPSDRQPAIEFFHEIPDELFYSKSLVFPPSWRCAKDFKEAHCAVAPAWLHPKAELVYGWRREKSH
jgi:hypothetical protein